MQEEEKEKEDGCSYTANNKAAGGREGEREERRERGSRCLMFTLVILVNEEITSSEPSLRHRHMELYHSIRQSVCFSTISVCVCACMLHMCFSLLLMGNILSLQCSCIHQCSFYLSTLSLIIMISQPWSAFGPQATYSNLNT